VTKLAGGSRPTQEAPEEIIRRLESIDMDLNKILVLQQIHPGNLEAFLHISKTPRQVWPLTRGVGTDDKTPLSAICETPNWEHIRATPGN